MLNFDQLIYEKYFKCFNFFFLEHHIDEEALLLLDKQALSELVPQIGIRLKLQKKISDYQQEKQNNCIETNKVVAIEEGNSAAGCEIQLHEVTACPVVPSPPALSSSKTFDVLGVVKDHCQEIWEKLNLGKSISYLEKLRISRVLVSKCLVEKCGAFPTTQEKETLAKEIITVFPSLKGVDGSGYVSLMYPSN